MPTPKLEPKKKNFSDKLLEVIQNTLFPRPPFDVTTSLAREADWQTHLKTLSPPDPRFHVANIPFKPKENLVKNILEQFFGPGPRGYTEQALIEPVAEPTPNPQSPRLEEAKFGSYLNRLDDNEEEANIQKELASLDGLQIETPQEKSARAESFAYRGIVAYRNDDLSSALAQWSQATRLNPENVWYKKNIQRAINKIKYLKNLGLYREPAQLEE